MPKTFLLLMFLSCLAAAGCSSSDPRLAGKLYEDALALSQEGRHAEAAALMEEVVKRFPELPEGRRAKQDLVHLELVQKHALDDEMRTLRRTIGAVCEALLRYQKMNGEYPSGLEKLVPDYGLDRLPLTPWGHPLFYRPYVRVPQETVLDRRRRPQLRGNTRYDAYHLACLGKDLNPAERGKADDIILVVNGRVIPEKHFPPIPGHQPYR